MNRRELLKRSGFVGLCGLLPSLPKNNKPEEERRSIAIEFPQTIFYNDDMEPIREGPLTITIVGDVISYN